MLSNSSTPQRPILQHNHNTTHPLSSQTHQPANRYTIIKANIKKHKSPSTKP